MSALFHPYLCGRIAAEWLINMKYESVSHAIEEFKKLQRVNAAYNHVLGVTYLDAATAAPKESAAGRGQAMGILSEITYNLIANENNGVLLEYLENHVDELDVQTKREVEVFRKEYDRIHRIPAHEYTDYTVLRNDAMYAWEEAKNSSDFSVFAPYLEKLVIYNQKFAGYYNPDMEPYDALLNEFEEGLNTNTLDVFFAQLRQTIVPLLKKVTSADQIDDSFLFRHYPITQQREFSDYLMEVLELNRDVCAIAETEHPFTTNFNNKDVRITTHYYEDMVASSMYSVIHEAGHAIYELGCDDRYNFSFLSGGVSMGIHESQSRFFENIIGRSYAFIQLIYPKMQEIFKEQLADVTAEQFYRAVNKAQPSLIRTEADDLSYTLHVMVRYELEKQLIAGTLAVKDIPEHWNRLYKEYLGVDVPDDKHGCLQDSHWSDGMFGYFPSYALGSAYGPQMLHMMEQDIGSIDTLIAAGQIGKIKEWLRQHIHQHAAFIKPGDLFRSVCGQFDAKYYTDYLTKKYTKLYHLEQ